MRLESGGDRLGGGGGSQAIDRDAQVGELIERASSIEQRLEPAARVAGE